MATNPNPMNRTHASEMQLWTLSDASHLTVSKATSRVSCLHLLIDAPNDETLLSEQNPPLNSPTRAKLGILKMVATSASEAELGAAYSTKI